jgi:ATP-binding cassette subfamily G (WHITE) protein 2 (PDR)
MHQGFKGDCIYLAENDVHLPELSLGQTLSFAAATRIQGSRRRIKADEKAQGVSSLFNLGTVFHTKVGNTMIRGISGGEK